MHTIIFTINAVWRIAYYQAFRLEVGIMEGQYLIFYGFKAYDLRAQVRAVVFGKQGLGVFQRYPKLVIVRS